MKYTSEIIIELPLEDFVRKLDSPENMKHWQKGLIKYEELNEYPRAVGVQMILEY